jgi:hypothetical protein
MVRLTVAQARRTERLGLWPEKLGREEVSRRLLLEHLLWAESERNLIQSAWVSPQGAK